ncbi:unnamed protein product, partial [Didymodactylos carnosus]
LIPSRTTVTMSDRGGNRRDYRDNDRDRDDSRRDQSGVGASSQYTTNNREEYDSSHYQSAIGPRSSSVSTKKVMPASSSVTVERFYSYGAGGIPLKSGTKSAAVVAIRENREREKRELGQLNDRFASYIERVRYLEAQNKKLQLELEHLRGKWGEQTSKVKDMFGVEIREARRIIDETAKDRATAEVRAKRAEEDTKNYKDK